MAAAKKAGARKSTSRTRAPRAPKLPPVTVRRLEEGGRLLERLGKENQSIFIQRGQEFKEAHRAASSRALNATEATQLAMATRSENTVVSEVVSAEEFQESRLRAYDEPSAQEVLLAAGLATAPAFLAAIRDFVALVEMPADVFEEACEHDELAERIAEHSAPLAKLEATVARDRANAAWAHYGAALGYSPGEAGSLPVRAVWRALQSAVKSLLAGTASSRLIDSAASTTGPDDTSSTTSSTPTP